MRCFPFVATAIALQGALACSEPQTEPAPFATERVLLAAPDLFRELTTAEDPFTTHRPETFLCHPLNGFYVEEDHLELDTANCDYLAVGQPALTGGSRGARVFGSVSHFDLTAAEPAVAHLAVTWGNLTLTEASIPIPSPADVLDFELTLAHDLAISELVTLHLHNHGQNTYQFGALWLERAADQR
jgi:hypothetical protein